MAGYVNKSVTEFVHKDDKCPGNSTQFTCAAYDSSTQALYSCAGHRDIDATRTNPNPSQQPFAQFGPGSTLSCPHPNNLDWQYRCEAVGNRQKHVWYKNADLSSGYQSVHSGELVRHGQENAINDAINKLNALINQKADWGISAKDDTSPHKVVSGDVTRAEDLKYLERNVVAQLQDCICYSDCTCHGLSSYVTRVWCSYYGGGGMY